MGKAPAVIIIARHGARLDQANKQWHLTSPTPYDPPLTYGGWIQARALGARIGGILRAREEEHEQEDARDSTTNGSGPDHTPKRKRKHRIIIHSSPFVRCVQTSIAIGAGIRQGQFGGRTVSVAKHHLMHSGSPHIQAQDHSPDLSVILEPAEIRHADPSPPQTSSLASKPEQAGLATSSPARLQPARKHKTAELRVDAFLGEWLSPDYFENITPPPGSVMLVACAKAELLRPGETVEGCNPGKTSHGHFPGGWSIDWSPASSGDEMEEKTGLANMASLGHSLPNRTRSSTYGSESAASYLSRRHPTRLTRKVSASEAPTDLAYVPPNPTYAISSSDAIPIGYVAHARDACISVSYDWDSMRAPQNWGGGGEYGEEWSSMHRRFRNGLSKMIEWYEEHGAAVNRTGETSVDLDEKETDTVVILVTHGAGCNALLGALTNQPVLLDVGMASLTMAVRKPGARSAKQRRKDSECAKGGSDSASPSQRRNSRRGSIDLGISHDYEIKYTASTDHLRAGSNPFPLASNSLSPRIGPSTTSTTTHSPYRRQASSLSSDNFSLGESASAFSTAAPPAPATGPGLPQRNTSTRSGLRSHYHPAALGSSGNNGGPRISTGLWRSGLGAMSRSSSGTGTGSHELAASGESGTESDSLPNFGGMAAVTARSGRRLGMHGREGRRVGLDMDGLHVLDRAAEKRLDDNRDNSSLVAASHVRFEEKAPQQQQQQQQFIDEPASGPGGGGGGGGGGGRSGNMSASENTNASTASTQSPRASIPNDLMRIPSHHTHTPTRTASHKGLWGGGGDDGGGGGGGAASAFVRDREGLLPPKRRWTALDQRAG